MQNTRKIKTWLRYNCVFVDTLLAQNCITFIVGEKVIFWFHCQPERVQDCTVVNVLLSSALQNQKPLTFIVEALNQSYIFSSLCLLYSD
jgi:hypothetical protein